MEGNINTEVRDGFVFYPEYKRMNDETREEYQWRICENKSLGIYDLDWEEVAYIINTELNQDFSSSRYRKPYQDGVKILEFKMKDIENSKEIIEEMKKAKLQLEMEKKKVQTEAVFNNRLIREASRDELLIERVEEAVRGAELEVPVFYPLYPKKNDEEWVLGISDVHAYKYFKSITNEYSKAILEDRMNKLLGEIETLINKEEIDKITVINGGDSLEGILRNSALQTLELGVVDTVVMYQRWILEWLKELSVLVEVDYIHLISSNHTETRPLNSRAGQFPKEDFEIAIANYLLDMTKDNERINVIVPDDLFHTFELVGYNFIAHHGHGISGTRKYIERMSRKLRIFIDYGIFGHLHKSAIEPIDEGLTNDCEILRLPSIVGTDTYADSILEGSKAGAVVYKFERGKGRTQENKIILN